MNFFWLRYSEILGSDELSKSVSMVMAVYEITKIPHVRIMHVTKSAFCSLSIV